MANIFFFESKHFKLRSSHVVIPSTALVLLNLLARFAQSTVAMSASPQVF